MSILSSLPFPPFMLNNNQVIIEASLGKCIEVHGKSVIPYSNINTYESTLFFFIVGDFLKNNSGVQPNGFSDLLNLKLSTFGYCKIKVNNKLEIVVISLLSQFSPGTTNSLKNYPDYFVILQLLLS